MSQKAILKSVGIIFLAFLAGIGGSLFMNSLYDQGENREGDEEAIQEVWPDPPQQDIGHLSRFDEDADPDEINNPFRKASAISRPSVVYLRVKFYTQRDVYGDWGRLWDFFGHRGPRTSSGSGVILSENGYIITNNHVIENAEEIQVSLHNRRGNYEAEVVGRDENTDLALLKIEANDLQPIDFANSDRASIGDWVLAVGNPFNLESTVTAGILSARSRNINVVRGEFPIESFLQTDAAINPGNSGGALVDLRGKLVGVNTAILSKSGTYAGYGFAIPSNIVQKIATDLREYGAVQRAFIEADIIGIDQEIAEEIDQDVNQGVYVHNVPPQGNAAEAGLQEEDIIISVNDRKVDNMPFFQEQIAYHRPGDEIELEVKRNGSVEAMEITLKNRHGTTEIVEDRSIKSEVLRAEFEEVSNATKRELGIDHGVRISNIRRGPLQRVGIPEGFIITRFNREPYHDPEKLIEALENSSGRFIIEGYRPDGSRATYSFFAR